MAAKEHVVTPDGRYLIVNDRLWRCADPMIPWERRHALVKELMRARRAVAVAKTTDQLMQARAAVDKAKNDLGERGPVWWMDGEPDLTGKKVQNSPYAEWFGSTRRQTNND